MESIVNRYRGRVISRPVALAVISEYCRPSSMLFDAFKICASKAYADSPELEDIINNVQSDMNALIRALRMSNAVTLESALNAINDDFDDIRRLPDYQIDELFDN